MSLRDILIEIRGLVGMPYTELEKLYRTNPKVHTYYTNLMNFTLGIMTALYLRDEISQATLNKLREDLKK